MELHQVRYFIAVARHMSFTRAAEELRVAQPSLTRAVQKLEAELGGPLLRRERSNTHLTELGRLMLPHLHAALSAADNAKVQAKLLQENAVGSLVLGIGTGIEGMAGVLLEAVGDQPNLELLCEVAAEELVERRLLAGSLDAALIAPVEPGVDRFDLCHLRTDDLVVAFADGHRFAERSTVGMQVLAEEPLALHFGSRVQEAFARHVEALGLTLSVRLRSSETRCIADFVRSGRGCAVLPASSAAGHALAHRRLNEVPFQHCTVLATVAGRRHSAALALLLNRWRQMLEAGQSAAVPRQALPATLSGHLDA